MDNSIPDQGVVHIQNGSGRMDATYNVMSGLDVTYHGRWQLILRQCLCTQCQTIGIGVMHYCTSCRPYSVRTRL